MKHTLSYYILVVVVVITDSSNIRGSRSRTEQKKIFELVSFILTCLRNKKRRGCLTLIYKISKLLSLSNMRQEGNIKQQKKLGYYSRNATNGPTISYMLYIH